MSYYFSKTIDATMDEAIERVRSALAEKGFGVLTEINVSETLKKKINADMSPYVILGACHPPSAYRALQSENKIGTMLPCNVIVREDAPGKMEVAAIDPIASMSAVQNKELGAVATEVQAGLKSVIESL
ncbi:MAG: DUF302 domain-containing protein [Leptospiraceae bacterium]|nr:DUF302 domain-containing protein [Leptospiraceae bacterium]